MIETAHHSLPSSLQFPKACATSSLPNIRSILNSTNTSLKRKRSSSPQRQLPSDCLTPSPPASLKTAVTSEHVEHNQEQSLYREQNQDFRSEQEPDGCLSPFATLPFDANTSLVTQFSSFISLEASLCNSDHRPHVPAPASDKFKDQGTQTELELPDTEAYFSWSGRGRSPFKTPATAAIDGLKQSAKFVEWLEQANVRERRELERVIRWKTYCATGIAQKRIEIVQDRMDPMNGVTILAPPDVDEFHGRSRSPDKYIAKMRVSNPPVHHENLETYKDNLPEQMERLLGLLEEKLGEDCMPLTQEAEIRKKQPNGLRNVPRSAFGAMKSRSDASIEKLWDRACEVVDNTVDCLKMEADENGWGTEVVQKALEWETSGLERKSTRPSFSRAVNIQSQLLSKSCRQVYKDAPFETKKTDWALSFSRQHPDILHQYEALASDGHPPALSQMNNMATSKLVLYAATEVKVPTGNKSEARAQLFTWFQAGITRLRKLLKKIGNDTPTVASTLPLLGWTVIGSIWEIYMAIGEGNRATDGIIVIGPFGVCQCDTISYFGAFKLLQLVERVKDWAREVYWPWYCDTVIEPLKLVNGQPMTQEEKADEAVDDEEREALQD